MVEYLSFVGAAVGVAVQMTANALQQKPTTRYPYMHVLLGTAGFILLPMYDKMVAEKVKEIEAKQRDKIEQNIRF